EDPRDRQEPPAGSGANIAFNWLSVKPRRPVGLMPAAPTTEATLSSRSAYDDDRSALAYSEPISSGASAPSVHVQPGGRCYARNRFQYESFVIGAWPCLHSNEI